MKLTEAASRAGWKLKPDSAGAYLEKVLDASIGRVQRIYGGDSMRELVDYGFDSAAAPTGQRAHVRSSSKPAATNPAREYQRGFLPSPCSIVFTSRGRERFDEIEWSWRERAGGLFGWVDGTRIYIDGVEMNRDEATGSLHEVSLDSARMKRVEADNRIGRIWLGDLHSHVRYREDGGDPSPTDLRGWAAHRRAASDDLWAGIIVTPGRASWATYKDDPATVGTWDFPIARAWVARIAETGTVVVEPTEISTITEEEEHRILGIAPKWRLP
jgi:hypothetical protein